MPKRQQDNAMNRSIGLRLGVSVESVSLSLHVRPRPPHLEIFDSIFRRGGARYLRSTRDTLRPSRGTHSPPSNWHLLNHLKQVHPPILIERSMAAPFAPNIRGTSTGWRHEVETVQSPSPRPFKPLTARCSAVSGDNRIPHVGPIQQWA